MVLVEGGEFEVKHPMQGQITPEEAKMLNPGFLSDFYISRYPVTQRIWQEVMGYNRSFFKGADRPVESFFKEELDKFLYGLTHRIN
ncbi:MAG: SUMF1/EgtB/PvdO family nonheme iron enzyme, partial [Simkania sp.]|nr:SUMF1/EgtB/PvdO family nonheme iron enzyme [Simkania sp.]